MPNRLDSLADRLQDVRDSSAVTQVLRLFLATLFLAGASLPAMADSSVADAAERQDNALVARLTDAHADVNEPQPDGTTALHWAAHWNDVPTVDRLLRAARTSTPRIATA